MQPAISQKPSSRTKPDLKAAPDEPKTNEPLNVKCSAAHAEWLQRIRDQKLYKNRNQRWDDFCRKEVGMTGAHASRIADVLQDHGADYFVLAEMTPVTPDEFHAVAPMVRGHVLCVDGEAIPLLPENVAKLGAAVEKLRQPAVSSNKSRRPTNTDLRLMSIESHCRELTTEFRKLASPKGMAVDRLHLATVLRKTLARLGRIEMELGIY